MDLTTVIDPNEGGPSGKSVAIFIVKPGQTLKGSGKARIRLLRFSKNKSEWAVISNEVTVDVEF